MPTSPEQITAQFAYRWQVRSPLLQAMTRVQRAYNGDVLVPLTDMDRVELPGVANLLKKGIDQKAARIASSAPTLYCPPRDSTKKREVDAGEKRRKALLGWWAMNELTTIKAARRARHLIGYCATPVNIRWDRQRGIPTWDVLDPLNTFPAPDRDPDCMTPRDVIFTYSRSRQWLHDHYPDQADTLFKYRSARPDEKIVCLEYIDDAERVIIAVNETVFNDTTSTTPFGGSQPSVVLERIPNRAGMCTAVTPGMVTLDRPASEFDGMIGMYQMAARLTALEVIAAEKYVFPDIVLIGHTGQEPRLIGGKWADGRTGEINRVVDGDVKEIGGGPGFQTNAMIDRLERSSRLEGGVPAEVTGECADETTEILTAGGWKHYSEVSVGDQVLTLNHVTGLGEWNPVQAMNVFPATPSRRMVEMNGRRFSALTTLNHRWPVVSRYDVRKWKTSTELSQNDKVPTAAINADLPIEAKFSDALVEAVAWFYTEGSFLPSSGQISQSLTKNPENVERIRNCLTVLFGPPTQGKWRDVSGCGQGGVGHDGLPRWREQKIAANGVIKFALSVHASRLLQEYAPNKVPTFEFLRALTTSQLELFLRVSLLADNCGDDQFGQKDPARSEAFGFAAILAGRPVSYQIRVKTDPRPAWPSVSTSHIVRVKKIRAAKPAENAARGSSTYREVEYDGVVWCPTTPNGTWFARRRGFAYFTGNSSSNIRTGRRGDAVLSAALDFPLGEAQKVFASSYQKENKVAIAVAKGYSGSAPTSIYVNWKGASGDIEFVPNELFTTDQNYVSFAHAGSDLQGLTIMAGQLLGAGVVSEQWVREALPIIDDPEQEKDRITAAKVEAALLSGWEQQVASGGVALEDVAFFTEKVLSNQMEPFEAIQAVNKRVQQRQASSGPPGSPTGPAIPGTPEAQPGLAAGTPAQGQATPPTVPAAGDNLTNLSGLMSRIRQVARPIPVAKG